MSEGGVGVVIRLMDGGHWQVSVGGETATGMTPREALEELHRKLCPPRGAPRVGDWVLESLEAIPDWLRPLQSYEEGDWSSGVRDGERCCTSCGCTETVPCVHVETGEPCEWELDGRCSSCTPGLQGAMHEDVAAKIRASLEQNDG